MPGHVQRVDRQRITHRLAHDAPAEQIEHRGQVQPALSRGDVSHVPDPNCVRSLDREVAL